MYLSSWFPPSLNVFSYAFFVFFSLYWTSWFCREWCPCCTCTAWQKQPPYPSISRFLCCPISCTSSMLPHLNYLEKNASIVFHHVLPLSFYCSRTWGESWGIIFHYIWWTLKHETFSGQPHLGPDTSLPPELGHISLPLQWLWFWLPTPVFYLDQCYQMNWPYGTH